MLLSFLFFVKNFIIFLFAFLEVVAVQWIYGLKNFILDIEFMLGRKTGLYWRICWAVIIPLLLIYIFISTLATAETLSSGGYIFSDGAIGNDLVLI